MLRYSNVTPQTGPKWNTLKLFFSPTNGANSLLHAFLSGLHRKSWGERGVFLIESDALSPGERICLAIVLSNGK